MSSDGEPGVPDVVADRPTGGEALERYYRRRLREIARAEHPSRGRFVPLEELRRVADEQERIRPSRPR